MTYEQFVSGLLAGLSFSSGPGQDPDADFYDDLGWDSLQVFELLVAIEELAASPPPDDPPYFSSMRGAFAYYRELTGGQ